MDINELFEKWVRGGGCVDCLHTNDCQNKCIIPFVTDINKLIGEAEIEGRKNEQRDIFMEGTEDSFMNAVMRRVRLDERKKIFSRITREKIAEVLRIEENYLTTYEEEADKIMELLTGEGEK